MHIKCSSNFVHHNLFVPSSSSGGLWWELLLSIWSDRSTRLTSQTNTTQAECATGPYRSLVLQLSSLISPFSTSPTRRTWWSSWMATPTRWWLDSTGAAPHGSWSTSQATSSSYTSTRTALTRPKDLLSFTKVR